MSNPIMAEFYGGPRDGEILELPDLRDRWLFPAPVLFGFTEMLDDPFKTFPSVLVYDLILDPVMGKPSLSDAGRYRFRFSGER